MKTQRVYILGFLIILQLSFIKPMHSANRTWNGSVNTSWFTAGNWSSSIVPDSSDNIFINANAPNNLILTQNHKVTNFTIGGDTLDLGTYTLTSTGVTYF